MVQLLSLLFVPLAWLAVPSLSAPTASPDVISGNYLDLFNETMEFMDGFWDPYAGYLIDTDIDNGFAALYHTTRESSWYAAGLLARNQGEDAKNAAHIITNIISAQYLNASDQWYGVYQVFPEEPTPGTPAYPAVIYDSWDPNWRAFIGATFVVIVEEYSHLLSTELIDSIVASLLVCAKGNTYRVGGVDGDNFYPAYSVCSFWPSLDEIIVANHARKNPTIMSAAFAGWVGHRTGDANITAYGAKLASEVVALYDGFNTIAEFNSPTYAGVTLWGLSLWAAYFPSGTVQGDNGGRLITGIWDQVASMYNANLKNMAGPWDRTYGWDMNRYVAITALWIWGLVGKDKAPVYSTPADMAHVSDFQFGVLCAIAAKYHDKYVSQEAIASLAAFSGEHISKHTMFSPPWDLTPRNSTTWLSENLTIGMETFHENVLGGPSENPYSFSPAVIQWLRDDGFVGFISLYSDVYQMEGSVEANSVTLTYPLGNDTSEFTFYVSPNGLQAPHNIYGWDDILGINVTVSGTVDTTPTIAYCGANGGTCTPEE